MVTRSMLDPRTVRLVAIVGVHLFMASAPVPWAADAPSGKRWRLPPLLPQESQSLDPNVVCFSPGGAPDAPQAPLLMSPALNILVPGGARSGPLLEDEGLLRSLWEEATRGMADLLRQRSYVSFVACTDPHRMQLPVLYGVGIECEAILLWRQAEGGDDAVNWVEYAIEQGYSVYIRDRGDAPEPYHSRYLAAEKRAGGSGRGVWRLKAIAPAWFAELSQSPPCGPVKSNAQGVPPMPPGIGPPGLHPAPRPYAWEVVRMENGETAVCRFQVQVLSDAEVRRVAEAMKTALADGTVTVTEVASFFGEGSTVECSSDALQQIEAFIAERARAGDAGLTGRESVETVQEKVLQILGEGPLPAAQRKAWE